MFLSISSVFAIYHLFRGWFKELLLLSIVSVGTYFFILHYTQNIKLFTFILESIVLFILIVMFFLPKKNNQAKCPKCKEPICKKQFSCPTCGTPLQKQTLVQEFKNNTHYVKKVLTDKDLFFDIRDKIMQQYRALGYTTKAIDKHNMLMLKHEEFNDSHIIIKRINYNLIIEAYNTQKPDLTLEHI